MRVLLIKTSSLGDVVHTLAAVTEARRHRPNLRFDWAVEEAFAEVPTWHPSVDRALPVATRRWRRTPWSIWRDPVFRSFRSAVREEPYDLILDAQGLLKTAWLARLARGPRVGFARRSAREPLTSLFGGRGVEVPWGMHAIERLRALFAGAIGYELDPPVPSEHAPDYGIGSGRAIHEAGEDTADATAVLVHGTAWRTKQFPETRWIELGRALESRGLALELPWGSDDERARAERIAANLGRATVLPATSLSDLRSLFVRATEVWSVDTGLAHLAAAVGTTTTTLFGASDPSLTAPRGADQRILSSSARCAPCVSPRCRIEPRPGSAPWPPCMRDDALKLTNNAGPDR